MMELKKWMLLLDINKTTYVCIKLSSLLSRQQPTQLHLGATKRVLRYLEGTMDSGIMYEKVEKLELFCYTDSDSAGSFDDRLTTLGYAFSLGLGVISWPSKKQETVALSSAEAE